MSIKNKDGVKVIEIIGPAGAGKTALVKSLTRFHGIKTSNPAPDPKCIKDFFFYVTYLFSSIPLLIKFFLPLKNDPVPAWVIVLFVSINGWYKRIHKEVCESSQIIVMDEGPIYYLAYLYVYGPGSIRTKIAQNWWQRIENIYSKTVDIVVFVDAPNPELVDRIRHREKPHGVKTKTDQAAFEYIDNLRNAYEGIVTQMTLRSQSFRVLRFDTSQNSTEKISEEIWDQVCKKEEKALYTPGK